MENKCEKCGREWSDKLPFKNEKTGGYWDGCSINNMGNAIQCTICNHTYLKSNHTVCKKCSTTGKEY